MFESVEVIGASERHASEMAETAELCGVAVHKTTVWDGPTPPDSFIKFGMFRMARPEYMAYRKATTLGEPDAIELFRNLLVPYNTHLTCHDVPEGEVWRTDRPHMTRESMGEYLSGAGDSRYTHRAEHVLNLALKGLDEYAAKLEAVAIDGEGWR